MSDRANGNGNRLEQIAENTWTKFGFRVVVGFMTVIAIPFASFVAKSYLEDLRNGQTLILNKIDNVNERIGAGEVRDEKTNGRLNALEADRADEAAGRYSAGDAARDFKVRDLAIGEHERRLNKDEDRLDHVTNQLGLAAPGTPGGH